MKSSTSTTVTEGTRPAIHVNSETKSVFQKVPALGKFAEINLEVRSYGAN